MDEITDYTNIHAIMGCMSSTHKLLDSKNGFIKNKDSIVIFKNVNDEDKKTIDTFNKVYLMYCNNRTIKIDGFIKNNSHKLKTIISHVNNDLIGLEGKSFREIRETRNHYDKKIIMKDTIDNIDDVINLINSWTKTRGEIYGRNCHSGHDKNFFLKFYDAEKNNLWSNFFYLDNTLVGYSIVSKINNKDCYSYIIRKNDTQLRNLCLYIDFKTFQRIYKEIGEHYINWGASSGGVLKYKEKFPIKIKDDSYFLSFKKQINNEQIGINNDKSTIDSL